MKLKKIFVSGVALASLLGVSSCATAKTIKITDKGAVSTDVTTTSDSKTTSYDTTTTTNPINVSSDTTTEVVSDSNETTTDTYTTILGEDNTTTTTTSDNTTTTITDEIVDEPIEIINGKNCVEIISVSGDQESLYAKFSPVENASSYKVYVKEASESSYTLIDNQLTRLYKDSNNNYYYRSDAVGIKAGTYEIKIIPVIDSIEDATKASSASNIKVINYDRTGFAFSTSSSLKGEAPGAYNMDGTLKKDAKVIYLTESNKDTVEMEIKGTTYKGIANITQQFKTKNITTPLDIRIIGKVTYDNMVSSDMAKWYCLGIKQGSNLTIEGIGDDATMYGVGVGCNDSNGVEFRNLGFIEWGLYNSDADAIAMQGSTNVWVHDNDVFYGHKQSGDQAKGDGSCDLKDDSQFITVSYNHFWDSGKMSLCGMKSESGENYISYHHNWFDHSDSRHPRIRTMTVHVYNNYYDGNSKYGIGAVKGAQVLAEGNYFRNCKYPFLVGGYGTDATFSKTMFSGETTGFIKAYNNTFVDGTNPIYANSSTLAKTSSDAYLASSRDEVISSEYTNGVEYSNFDTNGSVDLGVSANQIQSPEEALEITTKYAGRVDGGDFKWTFNNAKDDTSYDIDSTLANLLINYNSSLVSVCGIENLSSSTPTDSTNPVDESNEVSVEDVIALIDALPASANVTASNRTSIVAAKEAYDSLSSEDKALVTNYSKLEECITALSNLSSSAKLYFESAAVQKGDVTFTVAGSIATDKGSATIEDVTYESCLKLDSKGSISFTLTSTQTVTIYVKGKSSGNTLYVNKDVITTSADVDAYTLTLDAGDYTISKKSGETYIYLIVIE